MTVTKGGVAPTRTELLLPAQEPLSASEGPEISIVVPALNERLTIGEFVDWCYEGLRTAGVSGEVIIVDSSSDDTWQIALSRGARVLRTPKRGLGAAYIDAIPHIRGKFVILGDCDLTYDFRNLVPFIEAYRAGAEFVMGSRFAGSIEEGAMPALHRYFGTPATTAILNWIYGSRYTDIHCGMRGLTLDAFKRIQLTATGWEYASEMVLKAARLGLKTSEVPVHFLKDRDGRVSHHLRSGFLSPWIAGLSNLKVMLVYSPDTFLIKPGAALALLGLIIAALSVSGHIVLWGIGLTTHSLLIGVTATTFGYSLFQAGLYARHLHKLKQGSDQLLNRYLTYERGTILAILCFLVGLILIAWGVGTYIQHEYKFEGMSHSLILGLLCVIVGVQTFSLSLIFELQRWMRAGNKSEAQ